MRTMRAISIIAVRILARPRPATSAEIANRARARREQQVAGDYGAAIAQELAAQGRAVHLYRTEGESTAARRAADDHARAVRYRAELGAVLFELHAHRTVSAT